MISADEIEALRKKVHCKSMACPFFMRGTLLPVITYFNGQIPWHFVQERADTGMHVWRNVSHEDMLLMQESYCDEIEAVMAIYYAFQGIDPNTPEGEATLQDRLLSILQEYVSKPEVERKVYFM